MFVHIRDLYSLSDLLLVIHRVKSAIRLDNEQIVGETPVLPPGALGNAIVFTLHRPCR